MDAIAWFLGLFAVVAGILALPYLLTWINLSFARLRPVLCRPVADAELPEGLMAAAQELRGKLESFGFQYRGAIANRSREHLGRSDIGVVFLRKLWERELRALADGRPLKQWVYRPDMVPNHGCSPPWNARAATELTHAAAAPRP